MRVRLLFFCLVRILFAQGQDYVCNVPDFVRMVRSAQNKVETFYSQIVKSSAEIANSLAYASAHKEFFPGLYQTSDLTPCGKEAPMQYALKGEQSLLGIHVLNRSKPEFWKSVEDEFAFITPLANIVPSIMKVNEDALIFYVAGLAGNCSTLYVYPYRDACGTIPMADLCAYYNERFNLFGTIDDVLSGRDIGHWSDTYTDWKDNVVNTYSLPIKDSTGKIRAQLGLGVGNKGVGDVVDAAKPSKNGHTFILNGSGHVIYASQEVVDILFGKAAGLTLQSITLAYVDGIGKTLKNPAIPLQEAKTAFASLPGLINTEDQNGSAYIASADANTPGHYIAWSRFEATLKTWFLVGLVPRNEMENASSWSVNPSVTHLILSDAHPSAQLNITAKNHGVLPFQFYVKESMHSQGVEVNASDARILLEPNTSKSVMLSISIDMDTRALASSSFIAQFVLPFYSAPMGYGSCFFPQVTEIIVHVQRQQYYYPSRWATVTIWTLCGATTCIVIGEFIALYLYRHSSPVLALSPRLCSWIFIGMLSLLIASVLNMLPPTVVVCEVNRWFFQLGFTLAVGTIAMKSLRNRLIFNSKKLKVIALSDCKLMSMIGLCLLLDIILLLVGAFAEPYYLELDGHCALHGYVAYSLLVATKALLWIFAIYNTMRIDNVPSHFTDTRLNAVLIITALLAITRLGLQYTESLVNNIGIQLFLGSFFMWISTTLTSFHYFMKLKVGYVTIARPKSTSKASRSQSISVPVPAKLKERLEALLVEIEANSIKLTKESFAMNENVKMNNKLMFEIRAELLLLDTQGDNPAEEDLERFLPASIRAAFDKYGPAMARRKELDPSIPKKKGKDNSSPKPTHGPAQSQMSQQPEGNEPEAKRLLHDGPESPTVSSDPSESGKRPGTQTPLNDSVGYRRSRPDVKVHFFSLESDICPSSGLKDVCVTPRELRSPREFRSPRELRSPLELRQSSHPEQEGFPGELGPSPGELELGQMQEEDSDKNSESPVDTPHNQ